MWPKRRSDLFHLILLCATITALRHCAQDQLASENVWIAQISRPLWTIKDKMLCGLKEGESHLFSLSKKLVWFWGVGGGSKGGVHRGREGVCCVSAHRCLSAESSSRRSTYPGRRVVLFPRRSLILFQISARGSASCPAPGSFQTLQARHRENAA